jgi:hypothetical protein
MNRRTLPQFLPQVLLHAALAEDEVAVGGKEIVGALGPETVELRNHGLSSSDCSRKGHDSKTEFLPPLVRGVSYCTPATARFAHGISDRRAEDSGDGFEPE